MSAHNRGFMNTLFGFFLITLLSTFAGSVSAVEKVTYYHNDALGSPVAATDQQGSLLWEESYEPYGKRLLKEDGGKEEVWFTGKQEESDFDVSYFGARWYDPSIGRFLAIDPAGVDSANIHSFNRYTYANNNPYKYVDPDGRAVETAIDVISLGISLNLFRTDPSVANGLGVVADGLAVALPFIPGGIGIIRSAGKVADVAADVKLNKQLASQEQIGELNSGVAERIAGAGTNTELRDASRLANEYGGDAGDWAKIRSSNRSHSDGFNQETHAYQNVKNNQVVEHKTKITGH